VSAMLYIDCEEINGCRDNLKEEVYGVDIAVV